MAIKYKWLADRLKELIKRYMEKGIEKLPTENEICSKYRVSRQTVRLSLSMLEQEGLITKKHGSGSFITGLLDDSTKNLIGILISSDQEYIYPRILSDIHNTLSQNGFSDKIFVTGNQTNVEREILLEILNKPLRGIIVEGCKSALPNPNLDLYRELISRGTTVIFLFSYYPSLTECLYVKDENYYGSAILIKHLVEMGHTSIGGIFKADDLQGIERYKGFMETMRDFHLTVPDNRIGWFHSCELDRLEKDKNTDFLKRFVGESLKSCTAVVCYNDEIAYWLIRELSTTGYQMPDDISIAAFDNTYLSNSDLLTVTTLSHKPHEMGNKAAMTMIEKLKGFPVISQEIPWELILKESTKKSIE